MPEGLLYRGKYVGRSKVNERVAKPSDDIMETKSTTSKVLRPKSAFNPKGGNKLYRNLKSRNN